MITQQGDRIRSLFLQPAERAASDALLAMNERGVTLIQQADYGLSLANRASGMQLTIPFPDRVTAAAASPDAEFLAMGRLHGATGDSFGALLDIRRSSDGKALYPWIRLPDTLMSVAFSNDGRWVAAGGWNCTSTRFRSCPDSRGYVTVIDVATGIPLVGDDTLHELSAVAIDAQRGYLAEGEFGGKIHILHMGPPSGGDGKRTTSSVTDFEIVGKPAKISFSAGGAWVAVATAAGLVEVHDATRGNRLALRVRVDGDVAGLWFTDGDSRLTVARRRGSVIRLLSTPLAGDTLASEASRRVGTLPAAKRQDTPSAYVTTCSQRRLVKGHAQHQ